METIKKGSRGDAVKLLQQKLNLVQDGIFGDLTDEAVREFQKENGLVVDGIVGNKTWDKLGITQNKRNINEIILHCAATQEGKDFTVQDIDKWHRQRGFNGIGYHYVIYRDGSINKGRDEAVAGAHTTNHNSKSIGICYIGGIDKNGKAKDTRTPEQKIAMYELVDSLMKKYNLSLDKVHGHYEYANKACPSFKMPDFKKEFTEWKNLQNK